MVNHTMEREVLGQIPPQYGLQDDGEATLESTVLWIGVSPDEGSDGGGGITGGRYIRLPPPEHSRTAHYEQAHYELVSGGGAEARVKGCQVVAVEGRIGLGGDVDGVLVGVTDILGGGGGGTDGTETDVD